MRLSNILIAGFLAPALASPVAHDLVGREVGTPTVHKASVTRQNVALCSQYAYHASNGYEVLNNLWGKDQAQSGSQCTYFEGNTGSGIRWSSQWQWTGGENLVKSYVYAGKILQKGIKVANARRMPTSIQWSYDTQNMRANVAYDIFTHTDPNHVNSSGDYELMIWLGRYGGIWPISDTQDRPIAKVNIAGYQWDLYYGHNGAMQVYSFVVPGDLRQTPSPYSSFNADVKLFFDYLTQNHGYPAQQQNLIVYQVGTEAFTGGPARFSVSDFSANVET
ncbi:glycoside hydrolase family 12 protein [Sporormia fimetaria CBS 119925]|uniref:Glycoside hydrolase family 12 protein n=1 Tax=Sporormia fimetaria CBS 119925 TaxID=1340428 RepID=A0A6A6VEV6_9PLEO|nr:glycoside hydrolase family 12 protein [Sporormia fimetaria CBS 119925]